MAGSAGSVVRHAQVGVHKATSSAREALRNVLTPHPCGLITFEEVSIRIDPVEETWRPELLVIGPAHEARASIEGRPATAGGHLVGTARFPPVEFYRSP